MQHYAHVFSLGLGLSEQESVGIAERKMIHKYSDFVGWHHGVCHLYPQSGMTASFLYVTSQMGDYYGAVSPFVHCNYFTDYHLTEGKSCLLVK